MNKAIGKIPKHHLDEFFQLQTALIKSRVQLCAMLFPLTFFLGSIFATLIQSEPFTLELKIAWLLAITASVIIFILSKKTNTFLIAKLDAFLIIIMSLIILIRYYILIGDAPFNVAMTLIFMFLGYSLIFPWFPKEIVVILLLHLGAYTFFIANVPSYIFKGSVVLNEIPDYIQGYIIMFMSFWMCFLVSIRERKREIEGFILLKEVEKKNKQMQNELELATRVHSRLIPHSVSTNLADIAVTYVPMYYMGGDYAKFYFTNNNKLIFMICDVTGHGVSAALLVNVINTEFERLAKEGKSPGDLLKELDRFIVNDFAGANMYLTAFCGVLDYSRFSRKFTYSSYGHPPQYIYCATNSKINKISAQTSFLGLPIEDDNIYQEEIPFNKGDQILLFTDGVTEARDTDGNEYGDKKLEDFIKENNDLQVESFNKKLLSRLNFFTQNNLRDDVFILSIKTK